MASFENNESIPADVYQTLNQSLELKCLITAHLEEAKEVNTNKFNKIFVFFFILIIFIKMLRACLNCSRLLENKVYLLFSFIESMAGSKSEA